MAEHQGSTRTLTRKTLFFFGLSEMPLQVAALPLITFIPNYYIQDLGLSAALVGTALLIARLFDVITDPVIGYISDRTHSRWGRRRIWMVAGLPPSITGTYLLFFPGPDPSIWWFFGSTMLLWVGWTMIFIPYYAWAAELSPDYHERSLITGWRTALGQIANAASKAIPSVALVYFGYGGTPAVVTMIGIMMLLLLPAMVGLTVTKVAEEPLQVQARLPLLKGLRLMWRNGPFKRLILAFFINYTGTAISSTLFIFYVRGVLGAENAGIVILMINYIVNFASIPFWVWVSGKIGKHRAWCAGLLAFVFVQPLYFFLGEGDVWWMIPLISMTGFATGTFHVMSNSMKADVIDLDTLQSGENRAGMYFAAWSMAIKLALAVAPAIALWTLGLFGFDSAPGLVEDPTQRRILQSVFILSTPTFFSIAAAIAWNYPITQERHMRLRAALKRRQQRQLADQAS